MKWAKNPIPTLSRSFAVVSFQSTPVGLSGLVVSPPNPSACPRVGVWDKPWVKFANYFETASLQFRFCPGKNGLVLRLKTIRNEWSNARLSSLSPVPHSKS